MIDATAPAVSNSILLVLSSARRDSLSSALANTLVEQLGLRCTCRLTVRDLAAKPIPHLTADAIGALMSAGRGPDASQVLRVSDTLIGEITSADTLVIASPMHNFGLPSVLKSWFDHVIRSGVTFRYTQEGYVGLLTGKKVYLILTRGGVYDQGAFAGWDYQEPHLRTLLRFIGLTDVEAIIVDGLNLGDPVARDSISDASKRIAALLGRSTETPQPGGSSFRS